MAGAKLHWLQIPLFFFWLILIFVDSFYVIHVFKKHVVDRKLDPNPFTLKRVPPFSWPSSAARTNVLKLGNRNLCSFQL